MPGTSVEAFTFAQYTNPRVARAFWKRRGDTPRPYERRLLRRLLSVTRSRRRRLGLRPARPLLLIDVGTGYGRDLAWLQAQPGIHALGSDYSREMLKAAKGRLRLARGTLSQMDIKQMGIREGSVDVVRAQAIFHHLPHRSAEAAMREIARILKPGGILDIFVRYGTWRGMLEEPGLGPRYFHYFTIGALRALLRRHGLRPLTVERVMGHPNLPCLAVLAEKP